MGDVGVAFIWARGLPQRQACALAKLIYKTLSKVLRVGGPDFACFSYVFVWLQEVASTQTFKFKLSNQTCISKTVSQTSLSV